MHAGELVLTFRLLFKVVSPTAWKLLSLQKLRILKMLDLAELEKLSFVLQFGNLGVIPEERGISGVELHVGDL